MTVLQSQELYYHLLFLIYYVNGLQGPKYLTYLNSSAAPAFVKLQHFLHSSAGTDHNAWNVLILS